LLWRAGPLSFGVRRSFIDDHQLMRSHSIAGLMRLVLLIAIFSAVLKGYGVPGIVLVFLLLLLVGSVLLYILVIAALIRCVNQSANSLDPPSQDA
jgi:hypothetical protein